MRPAGSATTSSRRTWATAGWTRTRSPTGPRSSGRSGSPPATGPATRGSATPSPRTTSAEKGPRAPHRSQARAGPLHGGRPRRLAGGTRRRAHDRPSGEAQRHDGGHVGGATGRPGGSCGDPAVRVLVVTGAGPSFCAGADIADLLGGPDGEDPMAVVRRDNLAAQAALRAFPHPTVAAVRGHCIGGGVELAA